MTGQIKVGVAILIQRESCEDGTILAGMRQGSHGANTWCPPGGGLEYGESVEACARREVLEETGLELLSVSHPFACTDDIVDGTQWITVWVKATVADDAVPKLMEPDKCSGWGWHLLFKVPKPHFRPFSLLLQQILSDEECEHQLISIPAVTADIKPGDYVFASRYDDGCPGDPWIIGFVTEVFAKEKIPFLRIGDYGTRGWRHAMRITEEQASRILAQYPDMEEGPSFPYLQIAKVFGFEGI